MKRKTSKKSSRAVGFGNKAGLSPGTSVFVGERKLEKTRIDIIDYTADQCTEIRDAGLADCARLKAGPGITWINVNGIHDVAQIDALGKEFGLHPLTLEDIVNTHQRPKAEEFPSYLFVVLKMMTFVEAENRVDMEHVSLILGDGYVISFQEDAGDVFDAVRERIRSAKGRIRTMHADYMAYALMDAVVDHYFLALERIGDFIEEIDDRILDDPKPGDIQEIHRLKRDILSLRKAVWPLREEIGALDKSESALIRPETKMFLRDLYDHTIQIIDMVENFRDLLGGMHDTYLSSISTRMNEIMKVLTIIATIFIPLTFIAGIYGMNFEHIPELKWAWGYYLVWLIMILVGGGMLLFFRRKKWL